MGVLNSSPIDADHRSVLRSSKREGTSHTMTDQSPGPVGSRESYITADAATLLPSAENANQPSQILESFGTSSRSFSRVVLRSRILSLFSDAETTLFESPK